MMGQSPRCYMPNFVEIDPLVLEIFFEGFLPNMGVAANIYDPHVMDKFLSIEASHKIWLLLAKGFRRRSLKMVDIGRTDTGLWVY